MTDQTNRPATVTEQAQMAHALVSAVIDLGIASTDDAHQRYELPTTAEPRTWGAITNPLLADGVLCRVGDTHTRRRVAHGRRIGLYARLTSTGLGSTPAVCSQLQPVAGHVR